MVTLALGMIQRGYQVELFCYAPGDLLVKPLYDAGIPLHRYFKRSRYSPDVIFALRNLVVRRKYNLVLSYLTTPNFYAILVGRILNLHRIPVIVSERRIDLPSGASLLEKTMRQFYRLATHVVTNSHYQQDSLANKFPWLRSRLSTIYNGYDLQLFSPAITEINNHPIKILVIASATPQKNGVCLVEALNILRQRYNLSPCVDWIGRRIMHGDQLEYLNQMNYLLKAYGLEQQWQWLNMRYDIVDQLHQHDVLVHPSYVEGLPNVVCEALACARPVIVSDTLDHSRLVQHGESGYLFDYQNPADLADKIKMFADLQVNERRKMGVCGRHFAEINLSQERLVEDYERLFMNVMNQEQSTY